MGHSCNVRCDSPVHCEVLYWRPGDLPLLVGEVGDFCELGRCMVLAVESPAEAKPHPDGHPGCTEMGLYTFRQLPERAAQATPRPQPGAS